MAFKLSGRFISVDTPFEHDGFLYPANWLKFASAQERLDIGVEEVADPEPYDQRFHWGYDGEGNLVNKDLTDLKSVWLSNVRITAGQLLSETDWMVVRKLDTGIDLSVEVEAYRQSIREASNSKEATINAIETVSDLANYISSPAFIVWPQRSGEPVTLTEPYVNQDPPPQGTPTGPPADYINQET